MPIATFYARKENRDVFDQLIGPTEPFVPWSGRALREPHLFPGAKAGARQLIGTAVDYLVRFYAEALNPGRFHGRPWRALGVGLNIFVEPLSAIELKDIENVDAICLLGHQLFCRTEEFSDAVLIAAFYLAQLEASVRAFRFHGHPRRPDRGELDELYTLCCFLRDQPWLVASERVVANPQFKGASMAVGGADADIIVDDMLIDVKTVTDWRGKERETFRQVVTYLALAWVKEDQREPGLHYLGAYLARHGELVGFEAAQVTRRRGWRRFVRWLAKLADEATRARKAARSAR